MATTMTRTPRFGLREHQVFWNQRGEVCCACCHIPYPGSDTWVFERWSEITPDLMAVIDKQGSGRVACEGCGKQPSRIVRERRRRETMTKRTKATQAKTNPDLAIVETPVATVEAAPAKPKRTRKVTTETPTEAPAPKATHAPEPVTEGATDADQEVVFAFRLSRRDRDAIHAAAGSAKASKFVKGLAVAAARGDMGAIQLIVAEVVAKQA